MLFISHCVSVRKMRSLRKTALLAVLASLLLLVALLHSWPARSYSTVDVWQQTLLTTDRHQGELPSDQRLANISFHLREGVARWELRPQASAGLDQRAISN